MGQWLISSPIALSPICQKNKEKIKSLRLGCVQIGCVCQEHGHRTSNPFEPQLHGNGRFYHGVAGGESIVSHFSNDVVAEDDRPYQDPCTRRYFT